MLEVMILLIEVIILGIVEGITEFLPVSSTGHVIVTADWLGFEDPQEIFTVVIQLGAIAAVVWYFRHDLAARLRGLMRREKKAVRFWQLLAIGTIPVGILGLLIDSYMEYIAVPLVVAVTLILGGLVLWWIDRRPGPAIKHEPTLERINIKQAWIVGFGQCLALVPGVSRAGSTIVSGLFSGMDRVTATAFSFYLSIPVMLLAAGFKLVKYEGEVVSISGGALSIVVGTVVSFIVALAIVGWLLNYVSRHTFRPFAFYRIALGLGILLWLGFTG